MRIYSNNGSYSKFCNPSTYKGHGGLEGFSQSFAELFVLGFGGAVHARGPPGLARERGPLEVAKQNAFHRSEIRSETRFVNFNFGKIKKFDKFSRADEIFFFGKETTPSKKYLSAKYFCVLA